MPSKAETKILLSQEESLSIFKESLKKHCSLETCYPKVRDLWSKENPLWGHCAVVSEIVRRDHGGKLLAAKVTTEDGQVTLHYWNLLPGNVEVDLTDEQFISPIVDIGNVKVKNKISSSETLRRVKILSGKIKSK